MNTLYLEEMPFNLSDLINTLKNGDSIELLQKNNSTPIALIVPFSQKSTKKRKLGLLEGKGEIIIKEDFKITEEEFISDFRIN